jgi:hypothetical protein
MRKARFLVSWRSTPQGRRPPGRCRSSRCRNRRGWAGFDEDRGVGDSGLVVADRPVGWVPAPSAQHRAGRIVYRQRGLCAVGGVGVLDEFGSGTASGRDDKARRGAGQGAGAEAPVGEGVRANLRARGVHDAKHLPLGPGGDRLAIEVIRQASARGQSAAELLAGPGEARRRVSGGKRGVGGRDTSAALGRGDEDRAYFVAVEQVVLDEVISAGRELAGPPSAGTRDTSTGQVRGAAVCACVSPEPVKALISGWPRIQRMTLAYRGTCEQ